MTVMVEAIERVDDSDADMAEAFRSNVHGYWTLPSGATS